MANMLRSTLMDPESQCAGVILAFLPQHYWECSLMSPVGCCHSAGSSHVTGEWGRQEFHLLHIHSCPFQERTGTPTRVQGDAMSWGGKGSQLCLASGWLQSTNIPCLSVPQNPPKESQNLVFFGWNRENIDTKWAGSMEIPRNRQAI